jgi:hypothetical protein
MAKINDTTTYPTATPAADDIVIGTDVSNVSNSPNGETANFKLSDIGSLLIETDEGEIGTYVFAYASSNKSFGDTVAGSDLTPVSAVKSMTATAAVQSGFDFNDGAALTGTWRCMGEFDRVNGSGPTWYGATLWLRIA